MIFVVVLYALLASTFVFAKKAVACADPFFLISFRMVLAGSILLVWNKLAGNAVKINKEDMHIFGLTSLFHIFLAFNLEFWALQYVSALKTIIIYSTTPFITALLSYVIYKETISLKKTIGIGIGLVGILPLIFMAADGSVSLVPTLETLIPESVLLCAVVSAAYAWFLVKKLMVKGYSLLCINGYAMLVGGVASCIPFALLGRTDAPVTDVPGFMIWTLALIFVANICVYNMYGWLMKRYSLTFISFAGFLCPLFGALFEYLFLGGSIHLLHAVSFALVFLGLHVYYKDELTA